MKSGCQATSRWQPNLSIAVTKPTKFDKVVGREVCRITSKGTRVYSFIDGDTSTPESAYLLALCEKVSYFFCCSLIKESNCKLIPDSS